MIVKIFDKIAVYRAAKQHCRRLFQHNSSRITLAQVGTFSRQILKHPRYFKHSLVCISGLLKHVLVLVRSTAEEAEPFRMPFTHMYVAFLHNKHSSRAL